MLVRELIALLAKCPQDATIDAECSGCGYGFDAVSVDRGGKSCTIETRGDIDSLVSHHLSFKSHEMFQRFPPPDILYFDGTEIRRRAITVDDLNSALEKKAKDERDERAKRLASAVATVQNMLSGRGRLPLDVNARWSLHYGGFLDFPNATAFTSLAYEAVPELVGLTPGDFRAC